MTQKLEVSEVRRLANDSESLQFGFSFDGMKQVKQEGGFGKRNDLWPAQRKHSHFLQWWL